MASDEYIWRLKKAIRELHGSGASHLLTEPVHEVFQGKTVWEGEVEVFSLSDESKATLCYAWSYQDGSAEHFVAILGGVPPIESAQDAVRAYVASQVKKQRAN